MSIEDEFSDALAVLWEQAPSDMEWLDCEMMGRRHAIDKGKIIVLDVIQPKATYLERRSIITDIGLPINGADDKCKATVTCTFVCCEETIMQHWQHLQNDNAVLGCDYYEGLVGKRIDSEYEFQNVSPSKTTASWVKYRFDLYKEKS
jgi:hypothetical protein